MAGVSRIAVNAAPKSDKRASVVPVTLRASPKHPHSMMRPRRKFTVAAAANKKTRQRPTAAPRTGIWDATRDVPTASSMGISAAAQIRATRGGRISYYKNAYFGYPRARRPDTHRQQ